MALITVATPKLAQYPGDIHMLAAEQFFSDRQCLPQYTDRFGVSSLQSITEPELGQAGCHVNVLFAVKLAANGKRFLVFGLGLFIALLLLQTGPHGAIGAGHFDMIFSK